MIFGKLDGPIYKRLNEADDTRESSNEAMYLERQKKVIQQILKDKHPLPDVVCLQEFWIQGEGIYLRDGESIVSSFITLAVKAAK